MKALQNPIEDLQKILLKLIRRLRQRILNIISHLGLNKKKAPFQSSTRQGYLNLESYFINHNNVKKEEQDILIVKAKELLSKPVKRKHIRSESQLVQKIPEQYDMLKQYADENSGYDHIQLSLVKLQEQYQVIS
ncbi:unnamed protein product [Paramecium octaurelia]|uniref:Uncharacterized protein n=1 Tax=Paramecium octaurelia TaxID=43137 RepID=A0A8S1TFP8_PAROT|nr:unnamed protein product [Paramecium octaurelia]